MFIDFVGPNEDGEDENSGVQKYNAISNFSNKLIYLLFMYFFGSNRRKMGKGAYIETKVNVKK